MNLPTPTTMTKQPILARRRGRVKVYWPDGSQTPWIAEADLASHLARGAADSARRYVAERR